MRIAQEEIFGPVVSVIPCRSLEEAIDIGNNVEYGLSASIYTQDINRAFTAMRDLYTGIFYVNAPTIGAEVHLPFGGTKNTGQRAPRGRCRGARRLLGVEVDLHRLQRQAPAGADRSRGDLRVLLGSGKVLQGSERFSRFCSSQNRYNFAEPGRTRRSRDP